MHVFVRSIAATGLFAALAGCASTADKIGPQYVSPLQFSAYGCDQLSLEAQRISARVAQLSGVQDQKATNDAIVTGVAIVVFWPAAFLVGGNDQNTAELSRLKGEFETIEQVAIQKKCGFEFRRQAAIQTASTKRREPVQEPKQGWSQ
jgi:outer membrane murein-binding lipoprotein Lpp